MWRGRFAMGFMGRVLICSFGCQVQITVENQKGCFQKKIAHIYRNEFRTAERQCRLKGTKKKQQGPLAGVHLTTR
jgi:hypothetical protein